MRSSSWTRTQLPLEITVKGEIAERTGMLVDLGALNKVIDDYVVEPFDHTFLNKDIAYFAEIVPTAENIALYISNILHQPIAELGATLYKVKLIESPNNSCEIYCTNQKSNSSMMTQDEPVLVRL